MTDTPLPSEKEVARSGAVTATAIIAAVRKAKPNSIKALASAILASIDEFDETIAPGVKEMIVDILRSKSQ